MTAIAGGRIFFAAGALLLACPDARAFTEVERDRGASLYRTHCVRCHSLDRDISGQRRLVGPKALPRVVRHPYKALVPLDTARDLTDYIELSMPVDRPGTLATSDVLDIAAFLLSANGVPSDGRALDAGAAEELSLDDLLPQRRWSRRSWLVGGGSLLALGAFGMMLWRRRNVA
jgi:mono/diheme cytochrome c family protein